MIAATKTNRNKRSSNIRFSRGRATSLPIHHEAVGRRVLMNPSLFRGTKARDNLRFIPFRPREPLPTVDEEETPCH